MKFVQIVCLIGLYLLANPSIESAELRARTLENRMDLAGTLNAPIVIPVIYKMSEQRIALKGIKA